jgi:hypothetical protein
MSASLEFDPATQLFELRIRGILKRSELASCERQLTRHITAGESPRILASLEHFNGWERENGWDNLDFMLNHGDKIAKIAIVGAGAKEAEVSAFTGAGLRPTPVRFFTTRDIAKARAWLLE